MLAAPAVDRINYLNIGLIFLSCILAFIFPYHLLLFSYAVLGPAHYLTQISWMHDRKYFATGTYTPWALALLTIAAMCASIGTAFPLMVAICVALAMTLPLTPQQRQVMFIIGIPLALLFTAYFPLALFVSILLPTVIHVFIFTAGFMLSGTLKGHPRSGYVALGALFLCVISFFIAPANWFVFDTRLNHFGIDIFQSIAAYTLATLHITASTALLTRGFAFLSFVYTYHYLNWFSKTRIIEWHHIPRARLLAMGLVYAALLGVYAYNYVLGFELLLFLSLLHVVLEFPLDCRVFTQFAMILYKRVRPQAMK